MSKDLTVSLARLPRQLASRQEIELDWTVPEGWQTEVLQLPAGQTVPLDVTLTSIEDGVLVQIGGAVTLTGECVRCLEPIEYPVDLSVAEVFVEEDNRKPKRRDDWDEQIEVEGDELDADLLIENDTVDLERVLRDAVFGDAPLRPLCSQDCMGICEHCGILLKDAGPDHHHEFLDPRFAALAALLEDGDPEGGDREDTGPTGETK